ncbi:hypothetical protein REC12_24450 [Desulfosporosinus sp. PR]|uniref:hypothetical protein n=1 Tax=Candidatus Desulfosporosinus nitrosoreducens TaxID=3401928 RepID=UPI0027EC687E|nr:hypothetical protein [Desulfosporosinus sp. PR]MDQ7096748.1 hypothetical protein [Desulfosporosinus sp. PR]
MFKKAVSFIVIFVAISSLVYVFFANNLIDQLFFQPKNENIVESAHCVDRSGNIYYILQEPNQVFLVSLDSTGRQVYRKDIANFVGGNNCIFDNIFVDQDKNLLLTTYGLVPNSTLIKQVGIYMFHDDGSFDTQVFKYNLSQFYDSKFRLISSMSDDDKNIYFGFLNDTTVDVYAYTKGSKGPAKTIHAYPMGDSAAKINAYIVLPSGETVLSMEGGSLLRKSATKKDTLYKFAEKSIVDHFWFAGNQFYCREAVSGTIYVMSTADLYPSAAIKGDKIISDKDKLEFRQLNSVAVGNVGNVMGIINNNGLNRIFLGGFAFLPEIGKYDSSDRADLRQWFLLAGIIIGAIIVSLLLWDFYFSFLHMRLSILYRQAFLVILVIFMALYFLTNYVIVPQSEETQRQMYLTDQVKAGQMIIAAYKGYAENSKDNQGDYSNSGDFFERFRKNLTSFLLNGRADTSDNNLYNLLNTAEVNFIVNSGGQYLVTASNERYEAGYPASLLGYGPALNTLSKTAEQNRLASFEVMTPRGRVLCLVMPTGLTISGSPVLLSMAVGLNILDRNIFTMADTVTNYMRLIGLLLVVLVIIVEYFNVFNVRKLKKGVDLIAAGDYGRDLDVHSGDEIEDLSYSIRALSLNILKTTISLNKLNASYYRFVPQKFLEILGETSIENVGKKSFVSKKNMMLLCLRFRLLTSMGEKSEAIFANINDVFEKIVPVVSENEGTVYNFRPDGFNAVFEGTSELVLQTAFRIREVLSALNQQRERRGESGVDIRIYIAKGNIMLGFVGDEKRMEPAAISNEAQKADPILRICFDSNIYVACTKEIHEGLQSSDYRSRSIGEVMIEEEKVQLYDLYDSDPYALLKIKETHADRFELGVKLFGKGDYARARKMFMDIIKYSSQDGAARNYMYVAEYNLRSDNKQSTYTTIYELERMR